MNKEELYIITGDSREQLDLLSPSGITLKWVSNLFNDISKLTCSYSYTFKLPMTANNRRVLELADDIRHDNPIIKKSLRAEFFINGICLCPNANLYISEMTDSFSCVMTWKVLRAFETLKGDRSKLNELDSLGKITWGGNEQYGGSDSSTSNIDSVVYPDYDAGVPHMTNTPPKPCVPVYKLIQMINEKFGVKFNIGRLMESGMGMKPKRYLNNANYYGYRMYDDYVSNGVLPLVNSQISNDKFKIRGIYSVGNHTMVYKYLNFVEKWSIANFGTGSSANPFWIAFYNVTEGTYTSLAPVTSDQLSAVYKEPNVIAVGIPVLNITKGNEYIKPLFAYQHNTGLFFFNAKKGQKENVDRQINSQYGQKPTGWGSRTYEGLEQIVDSIGTTQQKSWGNVYGVRCTENNTCSNVFSMDQGVDGGKNIGTIGIYTRNAFTVKGSCDVRIAKSAVTAGRISVSSYKWMCIAAINISTKDSGELEYDISPVTEKSINSAAGFQSVDIPKYDASTDSYICHFEFGSEYDVRKIEVDANDDDDFHGYVFLPYFPEDHIIEVSVTDDDGNTDTEEKLNLVDGDIVIDNLLITELAPNVDVSVLPTTMRVTESLPDVSCFDFMKSVFYMNGAMPRVERDGETISAMYYNQLRDRVNDGNVIDWSDKILSADRELAKSSKFHNTKFSKSNYFEMSKSNRDKTEEEILEDFDQYGNGYGNIAIDDDTLKEETSVYRSPFYPAYIQNLRYPLIKVGNTCKVWEGDDVIESKVPAIYGYMVYRTYDPLFENTSVNRPQNSDITRMHKRMNVFSPFDDDEMMEHFFGYLKAILNDYQLVKEKFLLNEFDLRDFDESMPVYLNKYNSYFAVSSIQRDKDGVSTVELIKLPRSYDTIKEIDNTYSVEMLSTGSIEAKTTTGTGTSTLYIKRTKDSEWEAVTSGVVDFGEDDIYAIAGEDSNPLYVYCTATGRYRFTYHDIDTDSDKEFIKSEATAFFDGVEWSNCVPEYNGSKMSYVKIESDDLKWHSVEIAIPIRNQYDEVVETRRWTSPIIVASRAAMEGYDEDGNRVVVTSNNLGGLYVSLKRTYTSNQTAIVSNLGQGEYNGNCYIGLDNPIWAYPYEGTLLSGDSYTLRLNVYDTVKYKVAKYKDGVLVSEKTFSAKVRVYWDDERVTETTTKTLYRSEFGGYHTLKYECNLIDDDGTVLKRVRRRVIWFVSTVDQNALNTPYGTEHDEDANLKVNDISISGNASISDYEEHAYTMKFVPEYADIKAESVAITVIASQNAVAELLSQSLEGFSLRATQLPQDETDITVNIVVTRTDNTTFTKTKLIALSLSYIKITGNETDIIANNGKGSREYHAYVYPNSSWTDKLISVSSSNPLMEVQVDTANKKFTLSVSGVTQDVSSDITVVCERSGVQLTKTFTVNAVFKNTWSTDLLDQNGALIVDRNGMLYTADEWAKSGIENDDAEGIAISDGTHRFVMAKNDIGTLIWGSTSITISGIKTTTSASDALTDFSGKANTDAIIAQDSTASAAIRAKAVGNFPSGRGGYLGSAGEWKIYHSKCSLVDSLMEKIGGSVIKRMVSGQENRSTSTQYNAGTMWYFHFGTDNTVWSSQKSSSCQVRPFAELMMLTTPVLRGSMQISGPDSFNATNGSGSAKYTLTYGPTGVNVEDVSATSSNADVQVRLISNNEVELYVSRATIDEVTTLTVKARLNGLMETITKQVTVIGDTVVDFDKLDAAHVLIIDKDYNLYDEEEWYAANKLMTDANGIAVSNGTHRFVIALKDAGREYWGGRGVSIPGLSTNYNDYKGLENTLAIISAVTSKDGYVKTYNSAAELARSYVFPNGEKGYLGSAGEWKIALQYKEEIENLMSVVGADEFIKTYSWTYWTSTGGSDEIRAYVVHLYISSSDSSIQGSVASTYRNYSAATVRAFHRF